MSADHTDTKSTAAAEPADHRLTDTLEFMRVLWAVDHALQSMSKRMEQTLGVTGPQRLVVRIVGQFPSVSAGEIADILQIHPSTLTGILRRLESRGLLERRPDPKDGRRALFNLSKTGVDVDKIQEGTVESAVGRTLQRIDAAELAATRRVLNSVAGELTATLERSRTAG